jgi:hypothetical protein
MIWKATEWQSATGMWHCQCVDDFTKGSANWLHPVRILKMSPAEYVKMMVEKYHAIVTYSEDFSFVGFQWKNQADMRKFKNFINKEARTVNYQY